MLVSENSAEKHFKQNTGFGQIIDDAVREYPDRIAAVCGSKRVTYREFGQRVARLAGALQKEGVKAGDRVAVISRNCVEFLEIEFAVLKLGAVVVKINWRFSPEEIQYVFDLNDVRYAFIRNESPNWGHRIYEKNKKKVTFYVLNEGPDGTSPFDRMLKDSNAEFVQKPIPSEATAFHAHTSGTTGRPKCVVYTHGGMLNELESCLQALQFTKDTSYQMVAQLFHTASIAAYMCLAAGGKIVLMPKFEPREYLKSIEREHVTNIGVLPVVLKRLLDDPEFDRYDLSSLRVVNYSTCPMPPVLLEQAMTKMHCRFFQSYGMTEMSSVVTVLGPEDHFSDGGSHAGSVGQPIPGCRVKIVRGDRTECAADEKGEILVQGPGRMKEYFGNPKLTTEALAGGWYHTKDIGFIDKTGYLHVSGRKDDLIISGGENIYPNEIVNVMTRLADDIAEVAVYGVPDPLWGQHVKASVVLAPGSSLTPDKLRDYCRANMPHYKVPKEIEILDLLPRNATGKILYSKLIRSATG